MTQGNSYAKEWASGTNPVLHLVCRIGVLCYYCVVICCGHTPGFGWKISPSILISGVAMYCMYTVVGKVYTIITFPCSTLRLAYEKELTQYVGKCIQIRIHIYIHMHWEPRCIGWCTVLHSTVLYCTVRTSSSSSSSVVAALNISHTEYACSALLAWCQTKHPGKTQPQNQNP